MVRVVYPGSYKQIQTDSPVFIRTTGKAAYIGKKLDKSLLNAKRLIECPFLNFYWPELCNSYQINKDKLLINLDDKVIRLDKKLARCCYGYYEVECG